MGLPTEPLTIDRQGMGTGSVSAGGLSCPGGYGSQALPCGSSYIFGPEVTLTATPDVARRSSAAPRGTGQAPCVVSLGRPSYVAAIFNQVPTSFTTSYYRTDVVWVGASNHGRSGAAVIRHDYAAFGEDTQSTTGDPLRFAGKELRPETAMQYFGLRYYRQTSGQLLTVDPAAGNILDPQTFNRYAYAGNNPLRFVDPTGARYVAEDFDGQLYSFDTEGLFNEWCYLNSYDCAPDGSIYDAGRGLWGAWNTGQCKSARKQRPGSASWRLFQCAESLPELSEHAATGAPSAATTTTTTTTTSSGPGPGT